MKFAICSGKSIATTGSRSRRTSWPATRARSCSAEPGTGPIGSPANSPSAGVHAVALHGSRTQAQHDRALQAFHSGAARVLVATDVAARGIDVENVPACFTSTHRAITRTTFTVPVVRAAPARTARSSHWSLRTSPGSARSMQPRTRPAAEARPTDQPAAGATAHTDVSCSRSLRSPCPHGTLRPPSRARRGKAVRARSPSGSCRAP